MRAASRRLRLMPVVTTAGLLVALTGCSAETGDAGATSRAGLPPSSVLPTASVGPLPGQVAQTWTEPYGETTCEEWVGEMLDLQRVVAGAEMLVASRRSRGIEELPAPPQMSRYTAAIDGRCTSSGAGATTIAQIAAAVFADDADNEGAARQWQ